MYIDELKKFLEAVTDSAVSPVPLSEDVQDLELVLTIKQAAAERRALRLGRSLLVGPSAQQEST